MSTDIVSRRRLIAILEPRGERGAITRRSPRRLDVRESGHSEALYLSLGSRGITVRIARHPRTRLGAECGRETPDVDLVIGVAEDWGLAGKRFADGYQRPTAWLADARKATIRSALALAIRGAR